MPPFEYPAPATPWWQRRYLCATAWVACMLICMLLPHVAQYRVHDPDSRLYVAMAADLAQQPLSRWCAPTWNGHWQREGLFYEHPPGLLWAGAALVRLGCDPAQALYMCNFLALFASLALLWAIAQALDARHDASDAPVTHLGLVAVGIWVGTPAFLQYLVRGNQEHPLCFAILLGLYALVCRRHAAWVAAMWAFALVFGVAVKGIAAGALLPIAAIYLARYDRTAARLWAVGMGCLAAASAAWGYEQWTQHVTGASFWEHYLTGQVHYSVGVSGWAHKLNNMLYYMARPLWFGWPAVALLAAHASQWSRRTCQPRRSSVATGLGMLVTLVFVAGFSLANRKADRYIFPIYPALALAAANYVVQQPRWRAWVARRRYTLPYGLMLLLVLAVGAKIYIGTHHYRDIRWWPGA